MTDLAPHLAAFLHDYLPQERGVSRHTIASYADSLKLLVVVSHISSWNHHEDLSDCSVDGLPGMTEQSGKRLEPVVSPLP